MFYINLFGCPVTPWCHLRFCDPEVTPGRWVKAEDVARTLVRTDTQRTRLSTFLYI